MRGPGLDQGFVPRLVGDPKPLHNHKCKDFQSLVFHCTTPQWGVTCLEEAQLGLRWRKMSVCTGWCIDRGLQLDQQAALLPPAEMLGWDAS